MWLFTRVGPPMNDQAAPLVETFAARFTGIRVVAGVNPCVAQEAVAETETLSTNVAEMRLLACVRPCVIQQVAAACKALSTGSAGKWLLPGVSPHVTHQVIAAAKTFFASLAGKGFLVGVGLHVIHQTAALIKALPTRVTRIWIFPRVDPYVAQQRTMKAKAFAADEARKLQQGTLSGQKATGGTLSIRESRASIVSVKGFFLLLFDL